MSLHELDRQRESRTEGNLCYWEGGWIRWPIFGALVWGCAQLLATIRPHWIAWVMFGVFWVPFSLHFSQVITQAIFGSDTSKTIEGRSPLGIAPRCPNCGRDAGSEQALCSHCYEDLLHNCDDCGKVINAPHKVCRECARKRKKSKLSIG